MDARTLRGVRDACISATHEVADEAVGCGPGGPPYARASVGRTSSSAFDLLVEPLLRTDYGRSPTRSSRRVFTFAPSPGVILASRRSRHETSSDPGPDSNRGSDGAGIRAFSSL